MKNVTYSQAQILTFISLLYLAYDDKCGIVLAFMILLVNSLSLLGSLRLGFKSYQISPGCGWISKERGPEQTRGSGTHQSVVTGGCCHSH